MVNKSKAVTRYRSAKNGRFLTAQKAKRLSKDVVVKERVPKPGYGVT